MVIGFLLILIDYNMENDDAVLHKKPPGLSKPACLTRPA
jgi:hypothetical protein